MSNSIHEAAREAMKQMPYPFSESGTSIIESAIREQIALAVAAAYLDAAQICITKSRDCPRSDSKPMCHAADADHIRSSIPADAQRALAEHDERVWRAALKAAAEVKFPYRYTYTGGPIYGSFAPEQKIAILTLSKTEVIP